MRTTATPRPLLFWGVKFRRHVRSLRVLALLMLLPLLTLAVTGYAQVTAPAQPTEEFGHTLIVITEFAVGIELILVLLALRLYMKLSEDVGPLGATVAGIDDRLRLAEASVSTIDARDAASRHTVRNEMAPDISGLDNRLTDWMKTLERRVEFLERARMGRDGRTGDVV